MTTAANQGAFTPVSDHNAIPWALSRKLAASEQVGKGQFVTVSPSTGYARLNGGTVPNEVPGGNGELAELSDTSTTAGAAGVRLGQRWFYGLPASLVANDGFTDADWAVPFWIADERTLGKKSNNSGSNRSLGGMVFGLAVDGTPYAWTGPIAWQLARASLVADSESGGSIAYAVDVSASTDQGTATDPLLIPTKKLHGRITSIEIIPSADLAATGGTNYRIVTVYKIDTTTNVVGPVVGTLDLRTQALAKRTPTQFTLSATSTDLDMLETDVLGFASLHTSAGAVIPQSIIRANKKVG